MRGALLAALGTALFGGAAAAQDARPNVLFLAVDDLRPLLGCYGDPLAVTPNLDALATRSVLFERAYCQQAVCSPSRISVMTGLRPESTTVWDNARRLREALPDAVTLSQHFVAHGWRAEALGKIYHQGDAHRDPASWSVPERRWSAWEWLHPDSLTRMEERRAALDLDAMTKSQVLRATRGPAGEWADVPDDAYADGEIARAAAGRLAELAAADEPFFLAVGFLRPHLPFNAPKRWWDLYDAESIHPPERDRPADGAPSWQLTTWGELRSYADIPAEGPLDDEQARMLIHAYRACVSYIDAQVGVVLDALEESGAADETIVVLWSDHGWKLGDYGAWSKHTNVELDARVTLLASTPGMRAAGAQSDALVELVDLYPTLCEAAGLPVPERLEGASFRPLLDEPALAWKTAAFSHYPRSARIPGQDGSLERQRLRGDSMRTAAHRLTRWTAWDEPERVVAVELYDHAVDPGETRNVGGDPERAELVADLLERLAAGWRAAQPPPESRRR